MEDLISYTINFVMCAATHVFAQIFCMDQSDQVHFTAINFFVWAMLFWSAASCCNIKWNVFIWLCLRWGPSAYFWECCSYNQLKEDCTNWIGNVRRRDLLLLDLILCTPVEHWICRYGFVWRTDKLFIGCSGALLLGGGLYSFLTRSFPESSMNMMM